MFICVCFFVHLYFCQSQTLTTTPMITSMIAANTAMKEAMTVTTMITVSAATATLNYCLTVEFFS